MTIKPKAFEPPARKIIEGEMITKAATVLNSRPSHSN